MMKSISLYFTLIGVFVLVSCQNTPKSIDPIDAEQIYTPSYLSFEGSFDVYESKTVSGYRSVSVEHRSYAFTEYYALYSPKGNLELVVAGCSEACAVGGWKVKYGVDGFVTEVTEVNDTEDGDYYNTISKYSSSETPGLVDALIRFKSISLANDKTYIIKRDAGRVMAVGNLEVPNGYGARYYISEWGPFWDSDIRGGDLGFFVLMERDDKAGTYVNYLYKEGKLVAELVFMDGRFIKARTYNRYGAMVHVYEQIEEDDFLTKAYYDFSSSSEWYIEK